MADTATTRPVRGARRAPAKATQSKPAAIAVAEATEVKDGNVERLVVALESAGETKSYSKWSAPEGSGCVGTFYAPLGATEVKVAIKGATS